jgi:hypothetical protein
MGKIEACRVKKGVDSGAAVGLVLLGELISLWEAEFRSVSQYSVFSGHGVGDGRIVEPRSCSAIADHRKHELFHPRFSLDLGARHGAGRGGGVTG